MVGMLGTCNRPRKHKENSYCCMGTEHQCLLEELVVLGGVSLIIKQEWDLDD